MDLRTPTPTPTLIVTTTLHHTITNTRTYSNSDASELQQPCEGPKSYHTRSHYDRGVLSLVYWWMTRSNDAFAVSPSEPQSHSFEHFGFCQYNNNRSPNTRNPCRRHTDTSRISVGTSPSNCAAAHVTPGQCQISTIHLSLSRLTITQPTPSSSSSRPIDIGLGDTPANINGTCNAGKSISMSVNASLSFTNSHMLSFIVL